MKLRLKSEIIRLGLPSTTAFSSVAVTALAYKR